jgi:hypothetical protein
MKQISMSLDLSTKMASAWPVVGRVVHALHRLVSALPGRRADAAGRRRVEPARQAPPDAALHGIAGRAQLDLHKLFSHFIPCGVYEDPGRPAGWGA